MPLFRGALKREKGLSGQSNDKLYVFEKEFFWFVYDITDLSWCQPKFLSHSFITDSIKEDTLQYRSVSFCVSSAYHPLIDGFFGVIRIAWHIFLHRFILYLVILPLAAFLFFTVRFLTITLAIVDYSILTDVIGVTSILAVNSDIRKIALAPKVCPIEVTCTQKDYRYG